MEQENTDNPFRSISPLNLDTQILNQELPRLILPIIPSPSRSEHSFRTAKTYNSPSMSISSSNTNIDETLMMSTIDNLRTENASLVVGNIMLEEEIDSLKNDKKVLHKEIQNLKKKYNDIEVIEEPQNVGLYILLGGSITTCVVFAINIWKKY